MASPAFLIKLVNAWFIIVSSTLALKSLYEFSKLMLTFGEETSKSNITSFNNLVMFVGRLIGSGILANLENSSTILRKSFVWRIITSHNCERFLSSSANIGEYLRFNRSADNCMGVSGFFIS